MIEMQVGDQTIRYDREATIAVYEKIERGYAEECDCVFCRNFAAQRVVIYPPSFRALLEQLGIDPDKEGEAFEYGPFEDGWHLYGGWFYLVGELVTAGERNVNAADGHGFDFFLGYSHPSAPAFGAGKVLAVEFTAHAKWVISERPEYRTTSGDIWTVNESGERVKVKPER